MRADHAKKLEAMTDEERKQYDEERAAVREKRKKEAEEAKARKKAALTAPQCVVIDLEFGDLMEEKEKKWVACQLEHLLQRQLQGGCSRSDHVTGLGSGMVVWFGRCAAALSTGRCTQRRDLSGITCAGGA